MSIIAENLSYIYSPGTPWAAKALDQVDLEIQDGEIIGLIGHTGSGKSTLIQHFNGLLKPTSGIITVQGIRIGEKGVNLRKLRQKVGLVFHTPSTSSLKRRFMPTWPSAPRIWTWAPRRSRSGFAPL